MLSQIRALLLWLAALALVVTGFWWAGHSREPEMQAGRKVITWMLHISPLLTR